MSFKKESEAPPRKITQILASPDLAKEELLSQIKSRSEPGLAAAQPTAAVQPAPVAVTPEATAPQALVLCQDPALLSVMTQALAHHKLQTFHLTTPGALHTSRMAVPHPAFVVLEVGEQFLQTFDIYRQLRQTSTFANTPVLFVIAPQQSNEALEACNLLNNDYIVRPLDVTVAHEKISRLLKPRSTTPEETHDRLPPGELIAGRFEMIRFVGQGGMGQVYLVRDLQNDREVALKLIYKEGDDEENKASRRFQKEIEALLALDHPNVIKLYDYGSLQDFSYYTMDYLPYGCLADLLDEKGAIPYMRALQIFIPLASALFHAHQAGILHRDLKPENIMFKKGGAPVLTDFGLALQIELKQTRLTQKGHIIGTAYYMSPEQITKPHALDARSDIYSLGALLYEMLTGEPPFSGDNPFEILRQVLTEPTPKAKDRHDAIPQKVSDFCQIAMHRDREQRFPSAAAMVQAAAMLLTQK